MRWLRLFIKCTRCLRPDRLTPEDTPRSGATEIVSIYFYNFDSLTHELIIQQFTKKLAYSNIEGISFHQT